MLSCWLARSPSAAIDWDRDTENHNPCWASLCQFTCTLCGVVAERQQAGIAPVVPMLAGYSGNRGIWESEEPLTCTVPEVSTPQTVRQIILPALTLVIADIHSCIIYLTTPRQHLSAPNGQFWLINLHAAISCRWLPCRSYWSVPGIDWSGHACRAAQRALH